jgi:Acyclic terpene utilisation family protein AtuA
VPEVKMLAGGMVGLGFSLRGFRDGLERRPDMIGCDAGSADTGPGPLGTGKPPKARRAVESDLRHMLRGAQNLGVPLIVGSCGGAGGLPHLRATEEVVRDIAAADGFHFRLGLIHAEQEPESLIHALRAGRIKPLGPFADLTESAISRSERIVAMMGAGPIIEALDRGADVVLAGRCTDPAIFASYALKRDLPPGPSWHAAKSIDKGPLATSAPVEGSPVLATVRDDHFIVEATKKDVICDISSVAGITLHENPDPWSVHQPTGAISTKNARYEAVDGKVVVRNSEYTAAVEPSVKLEGASLAGYRSIVIAGIRDPRLLARLDEFLQNYNDLAHRIAHALSVSAEEYSLRFRVYGRDGVMGDLEPFRESVGKEVCLIIDVVSQDQDLSYLLASRTGSIGSRYDFTGKLGGGANFAYPFSLPVINLGPVYVWSAWHLLSVDNECDPFQVEMVDL